jgi:hypothetical protein
MRAILDLGTALLTNDAGGELDAVISKRASRSLVAIPVRQAGLIVEEEIDDLEIKVTIKDVGEYDQTPLIALEDITWNADTLQYEGYVNYLTDALNERFGVQSTSSLNITGVASTNLITTAAPHGYAVGNRVELPSLNGGAGLSTEEGDWYYIISDGFGASTLKLSLTEGGAAVDFTTDIIATSTIRLDPADVASITLAVEVAWRFDPLDDWSPTINEIALSLRNNYTRDDDPAAPDAGGESWLERVGLRNPGWYTSLTGGGDHTLDGVETGTTAAPRMITGYVITTCVSAIMQDWQLQAGTTAENASGGIVRPDDYAASTNERIWVEVT